MNYFELLQKYQCDYILAQFRAPAYNRAIIPHQPCIGLMRLA